MNPGPSPEPQPRRESPNAARKSPQRVSTPDTGAIAVNPSPVRPPEATNASASAASDEAELIATWQELVERIMKERPDVSAVLEHAVLLEATRENLVVGWPENSVFTSQLDDALVKQLIVDARIGLGKPATSVSIVQGDPRARGRDTLASREIAERTMRYRQEQARIRNHPRVKDVQEILGGRIVAVKLADH